VLYRMRPQRRFVEARHGRIRYSRLKEAAHGVAAMEIQLNFGVVRVAWEMAVGARRSGSAGGWVVVCLG